jgi:hypothetical protein
MHVKLQGREARSLQLECRLPIVRGTAGVSWRFSVQHWVSGSENKVRGGLANDFPKTAHELLELKVRICVK